jgi:uncharacterized protein (DUF1810 family)
MGQAEATRDNDDLERFVTAQAAVYDTVVRELRAGEKRTHWIWFIFPQLRGLGRSSTARFFGITSLAEARAYLAHPLLGLRLVDCVQLILDLSGPSLHDIFGSPDDLKFRSSMTLFAAAADTPENVFRAAMDRYCGGAKDEHTLELLAPSRI